MTAELAAFTAAIDRKYAEHEQAFEDRDPEPILNNFFTQDALWEYRDFPRHVGTAQLRQLFNEVIAKDRVKVSRIQAFVSGDAGWDYADYRVTPRDPANTPWTFRQMFYWVRQDGDWKVNACIGFIVPGL